MRLTPLPFTLGGTLMLILALAQGIDANLVLFAAIIFAFISLWITVRAIKREGSATEHARFKPKD